MTKKHTNDIWELDLPPGAKLVFLALYWRQGPTGCYPSQEEIGRMTGLDPRSVRRHLATLKKRGLVDVHRERHQTNPRHQLNRYTLKPTATRDTAEALTSLIGNKQATQDNLSAVNTGQKRPEHRTICPITQDKMSANRTLIEKDSGRGSKMTPTEPGFAPRRATRTPTSHDPFGSGRSLAQIVADRARPKVGSLSYAEAAKVMGLPPIPGIKPP